jgi:D-alanyl-D-alanine carboxypeptidase
MHGQKGVTPVKTGITNAAGPCLATAVELDPAASIIIVLLCSKDMDCRWLETQKLAKWATDRLVKIRRFKDNSDCEDRIL